MVKVSLADFSLRDMSAYAKVPINKSFYGTLTIRGPKMPSLIVKNSDGNKREGQEEVDKFYIIAMTGAAESIDTFSRVIKRKKTFNNLNKSTIALILDVIKMIDKVRNIWVSVVRLLHDAYHTRIAQGGARDSEESKDGRKRKVIKKENVTCEYCAWIEDFIKRHS